MTWMITVRATPLAFIRARSVSGAASRAGTLAPCANGKAGSCFQTWTCGSRMRVSADISVRGAARRSERRVQDGMPALRINCLQLIDHVIAAAFVAGPRTVAGDVEVGAEPALEVDGFEHAVTPGKIDHAVTVIEDV